MLDHWWVGVASLGGTEGIETIAFERVETADGLRGGRLSQVGPCVRVSHHRCLVVGGAGLCLLRGTELLRVRAPP